MANTTMENFLAAIAKSEARMVSMPKVDTGNYLIWWLPDNDGSVERIWRSEAATNFPSYLQESLGDAAGRSGRGRLWTPRVEGKVFPEVLFTGDNMSSRAQGCCGIVIEKKDLDFALQARFGFVSNWEMGSV
jgi:hypothetical protein